MGTEEKERHPIDAEFLEVVQKIDAAASKLSQHEATLSKQWVHKLNGTHAMTRNDYAKCLLHQVESLHKLSVPFNEPPDKFTILPPLHIALHGPVPDSKAPKTTWRSDRGKADTIKKMSQKELKNKFGTDRIGIHESAQHFLDIDSMTPQGFIGMIKDFTKDNGAAIIKLMQEQLSSFRTLVGNFYEAQTCIVIEDLENTMLQEKSTFESDHGNLMEEKNQLLEALGENFDWDEFRRFNRVGADQKIMLRKLRQETEDLKERNARLVELIKEFEEHVASKAANETGESLGLLTKEAMNSTLSSNK